MQVIRQKESMPGVGVDVTYILGPASVPTICVWYKKPVNFPVTPVSGNGMQCVFHPTSCLPLNRTLGISNTHKKSWILWHYQLYKRSGFAEFILTTEQIVIMGAIEKVVTLQLLFSLFCRAWPTLWNYFLAILRVSTISVVMTLTLCKVLIPRFIKSREIKNRHTTKSCI